jgi:hypothetical protein
MGYYSDVALGRRLSYGPLLQDAQLHVLDLVCGVLQGARVIYW